jgi:dTDP-4-dehydrorhamnose 3,5-epimerase
VDTTAALVPFSIEHTEIPELVVLRMRQVPDQRGTVRELFRESAMVEAGLRAGPWRQLNLTETRQGVIRGLHGERSTKLVGVVAGEALGAYVDTRPGSPARGRSVTVPLTLGTQVLMPPGVCGGFQAVSVEPVQYLYGVDQEWSAGQPSIGVHPLDPALGIGWPIPIDPGDRALLSTRDAAQPALTEALADL